MGIQSKKPKVWLHVLSGILVGGILVVGIGFFLFKQDYLIISNKVGNDKEEKDKNTSKEEDSNCGSVLLGFDFNKCINQTGQTYNIAAYSQGMNARVSADKKSVDFSFNRPIVSQRYYLGWVTALEDNSYETKNIVFSQAVEDVFFGGFGQSSTGDTLLFLMKDGTVEYIPLQKMFSTDPEQIKSYGKIAGIEGIVKFYQATVSDGASLLAQKADGSFYDLSKSLQNTGNY